MKYYLLNNYDSFVYNLAAYFQEEGADIIVESIDTADFSRIEKEKCHGIILSPGPGKPEQAFLSQKLLKAFAGKLPILGVCLGHQVIGYYFGANVCKGNRPMHGKLSQIQHTGKGLFYNLPPFFRVTRYHSLAIEPETLPKEFVVDAVTKTGDIMAISHSKMPIYGVQFHPEALLTEYGHHIIRNYITQCRLWEEGKWLP